MIGSSLRHFDGGRIETASRLQLDAIARYEPKAAELATSVERWQACLSMPGLSSLAAARGALDLAAAAPERRDAWGEADAAHAWGEAFIARTSAAG